MLRKLWTAHPARRWAACAPLAALALALLVVWPRPAPTVGQEIRVSPQRETFLSGGARSEIILREIAETLKRIDARLERFEQALRDAEQRPPEREPALQPPEQPKDEG
jgi:hypothetical protein